MRWIVAGLGLAVVIGSVSVLLRPPGTTLPTLTIESGSSAFVTAEGQIVGTGRVATAYVTLSPHCPISNACVPALNRLSEEFGARGIDFIGLVPGVAATAEDVESFADSFELRFPVLHDAGHRLCQQLNATHTPQVIVLDATGRRIYSGRIDDQFSRIAGGRRIARDETLKKALGQFLDGRLPTESQTIPVGCVIEDIPDALPHFDRQDLGIIYTRDIAPILLTHCARCHRPGEAAPFSLLSYSDTVRHAKQIRAVVEQRLMPPWKPVADFGRFKNNHRLTDAQIAKISAWVASGSPEGRSEYLPDLPEFADGWQLGPPDVELFMPEPFEVPADGPDIYQHFIIPTGLTSNQLIRAFEFRPGAPEVVHHAFAYFDTTGQGRELDAADPAPGYGRVGSPGFAVSGSLGGWGPGGLPRELPPDIGRPLPANADLVVQVHYHPTGRSVKDRSRIGLYFADPTAQRFATEILVADVNLHIPANAKSHHHHAEWVLPVNTWLLDATPHMHTLGKKIQAIAYRPDGTSEPLIRIDDWDFYWQDSYTFEQPVSLPAGTRIELDCWFDNSEDNPLNPHDPPQAVYWGDFSDDEMAICYFQATTFDYDDYVTLNRATSEYFQQMYEAYQAAKAARTCER
ncbi:MAG: redoxin family protein [Fuerstiella sp.]